MQETKIKSWDDKKKCGYIEHPFVENDLFFEEKDCLTITGLKKGVSVSCEINEQKSGFKASNIRITTRAEKQANSYSAPSSNLNPYHFIQLDTQNTIHDAPIWHDGKNSNNLLSGQIQISLEALTPLIVGQWQYKVDELATENPGFLSQANDLDKEKSILEPLRLACGRVVIPGSSIKGMIRHSLSGLLSAPMERVSERSYSYRPNAQFQEGFRKVRPALITHVDAGQIEIRILDTATAVYFSEANVINSSEAIQPGEQVENIQGYERKVTKEKRTDKYHIRRNDSSVLPTGYFAHYDGGIDGQGALNSRGGCYKNVWIAQTEYAKGKTAILPETVINQYQQTLNHLLNSHGHFAPGYPGKGIKQAKINIGTLQSYWQGERQALKGRLIYIELESDNVITSMGHHYYYRWRYANSIRTVQQEGQPEQWCVRSIVAPLAVELSDDEQLQPDQLSAARLLFGYTSHRESDPLKQDGAANIGNQHFQRLAGRLHINSAIERLTGDNSNARFLNGEQGLALQTLGQPRPSAVEHYLQQANDKKKLQTDRQDGGQMLSYGDLTGRDKPAELAGRKYYLHQPDAAVDNSVYTAQGLEVSSKLAMLARFVSKPETHFRFTLGYKDLRAWELGALLLTLAPESYMPVLLTQLKIEKKAFANAIDGLLKTISDYQGGGPLFAHKLGHGRPLGLGSVLLTLDHLQLLTAHTQGLPQFKELNQSEVDPLLKNAIQALAKKLAAQLSSIKPLEQWCAIHQYAGRSRSAYPKRKGEIFNYHTQARIEHIAARRLPESKGKLSEFNLHPLIFNPKKTT